MSEFLCFLDDDNGEEGCVFDSGEIDCCDEATRLVKFAIKADASKRREEMVQNQFQTDMYLASIKPEFIQTMNGTVSNREARRVCPGETPDEAIRRLRCKN